MRTPKYEPQPPIPIADIVRLERLHAMVSDIADRGRWIEELDHLGFRDVATAIRSFHRRESLRERLDWHLDRLHRLHRRQTQCPRN